MGIVPPRPHNDSTGQIMRRLTLDERRTASADAPLIIFRRSPSSVGSVGSSWALYLIKMAASPRATFQAGRTASACNRQEAIERPLLACRIRAILRAIRRLIGDPIIARRSANRPATDDGLSRRSIGPFAERLLSEKSQMHALLGLASLLLIALVLTDAFEAMVLPRRVTRDYRPARAYYHCAWAFWRATACRLPQGRRRETFLSVFGPLSILLLFSLWAAGLVFAFGLLHWSLSTPLNVAQAERAGLYSYLYMSGTTFFTLGYGDVAPAGTLGRFLAVVESGMGFGFMAVIIGYLPVLSQAASQREITISLLDARAGSPPTVAEGLLRVARLGQSSSLDSFMAEWERWSAQLLESHLSFPVLVYYRSQHDNQSWLSALTSVLDGCALLIAGIKGANSYQAQLTFAMARHAMVDLALVLKISPVELDESRLSAARFQRLRELLAEAGLELDGEQVEKKFAELRGMYEPVAFGLAHRLLFSMPPILADKPPVDNWQTSAWQRATPGIGELPAAESRDEHFR